MRLSLSRSEHNFAFLETIKKLEPSQGDMNQYIFLKALFVIKK